jgi:hypothetical protein
MADMNFNTVAGQVVARKMLILYLNTGTSTAPVWSSIGKRVEDSSMEFDWGEETKTDIFGNTYTTAKNPTITQTFDPCELDSGDTAQNAIWTTAIKNHDATALCNMDLLVVHLYAGTANTAVFAERYPTSMVKPSSLGGSNNLGMPIDVTFGGTREVGTAAITSGSVKFTKSAA